MKKINLHNHQIKFNTLCCKKEVKADACLAHETLEIGQPLCIICAQCKDSNHYVFRFDSDKNIVGYSFDYYEQYGEYKDIPCKLEEVI